jgi:hypothetical protein
LFLRLFHRPFLKISLDKEGHVSHIDHSGGEVVAGGILQRA